MYRAAAIMERMTKNVSAGPLKPYRAITCFSCHRGGGPDHRLAHPASINRSAVRAMIAAWPGDTRDPEPVRRAMSEYSLSLGVGCNYCHVPGNWKAQDKPVMRATREMAAMMNEFPEYFELARASVFTCYTCHQGSVKVP